ncbi:MAG: cysteine hydrolase [Acidimicrobiales bacterium]
MSAIRLDAPPVTVAGSSPYPWPYDEDLSPHRLALVVAGAQRWWVERTDEGQAMAATSAAITNHLRGAGVKIFILRHLCPTGRKVSMRGHLPVVGSPGAELVIEPKQGDVVVDAWGFDGFFASNLDAELRSAGRDHLVIAGLGLQGPVHSTLRSANDRGFECLLLEDATSPTEPSALPSSLSMVEMSGGIFGAVGTTHALLEALSVQSSA